MNKYRVGDIVKILSHISSTVKYGFNPEMEKFLGKTLTIEAVIADDAYEMVEDTQKWTWCEEMFEGLAESEGSVGYYIRFGNIVVLKDGKEMLIVENSIRSPKGFSISIDKYRGEDGRLSSENVDNENFNIVEIYKPAENSNYLFDKGELIWKSEVV